MSKEFKKDQKVNLIQNWDNKGTFRIVPAIVYSCGTKKMVLTHAETGEELGRNFLPTRSQYTHSLVIDASEDAQVVAMNSAVGLIAHRLSEFKRMMTLGNGDRYNAAIQKYIDELHEPQVI